MSKIYKIPEQIYFLKRLKIYCCKIVFGTIIYDTILHYSHPLNTTFLPFHNRSCNWTFELCLLYVYCLFMFLFHSISSW